MYKTRHVLLEVIGQSRPNEAYSRKHFRVCIYFGYRNDISALLQNRQLREVNCIGKNNVNNQLDATITVYY